MSKSGNKRNFFFSIIIMVFIVTLVLAAFMLAIFHQNVDNEYAILQSITNTESELVSNLIQKNKINLDKDIDSFIEILNQNRNYLVFAATGNTLIAKKTDGKFNIIWSTDTGINSSTNPVTLNNLHINGVLRALIFGNSPILIGKDHANTTVLSTYVPIVNTKYFLIAKIDLNELLLPLSEIIIKYLIIEVILLTIGIIFIILFYTKSLSDKFTNVVHELTKSMQLIKDLKKIEKSLEYIKNDMEDALEVGLFGVWSYDFDTGISNRSLRHDQIFGYDAVLMAWSFQTFLGHIIEEDRTKAKEHFERAISSSEEIDIACRITKVDGEIRWIWIRGKKREDKNSLIGIVRDITSHKKTEIELNDYRYHLQELVKERTRELEAEKKKLDSALSNIKTLKGLLPICSGCNKIKDNNGEWNKIEVYIKKHTDTEFSHGLCPDCLSKIYPEITNNLLENNKTDLKVQ